MQLLASAAAAVELEVAGAVKIPIGNQAAALLG
jgi:hypothetical protein